MMRAVSVWGLLLAAGLLHACEPLGDDDIADDDTTTDDDDFDCPAAVEFEQLAHGETYLYKAWGGDINCSDITVWMLDSQAGLELAYQSYLPDVPYSEIPPGVDFETERILFSYSECCSYDGNSLILDLICLEEDSLTVYATLMAPDWAIDAPSRVYNVTRIPAGEYEDVDLVLTVECYGPDCLPPPSP